MANRNQSGKNIDPGIVARVGAALSGAKDAIVDAFFGPLDAPIVVAPKGTEARQRDYPPGYNLQMYARTEEVVQFTDLRWIADAVDLVRLCIETRKDQLSKIPWEIRVVNDEESAVKVKELSKSDKRVKELTAFFRSPDKEHTWDGWLRMLVEDLLVVDAPSLYVQRTLGGDLYGLRVIDGTTITRKITADGTTPLPPNVAYQQIIKGMPITDLTLPMATRPVPGKGELIYRPRNLRANKFYGYSPVEQIFFISNLIARRQMHKLAYYTDGTLPDAIVPLGEDASADAIEALQAKFDAKMAGDAAARRKLTFVPKLGGPVQFFKEALLKDEMDEWLARVVCFCFSLPPTAFIKQMNRATSEQAQEAALEEGLQPLMIWVSDLINYVITVLFGYEDIEFAWRSENVVDVDIQSKVDGIYVDKGIISRNSVRKRLGLDPDPDGDRLTVLTTGGITPLDTAIENADNPPDPPPVVVGGPGGPAGAKPGATAPPKPGKGPKAAMAQKRNEMATHLMEVYEDLHPELRDPVIVAKLATLETADNGQA